MEKNILLQAQGLTKHFLTNKRQVLHAVSGVNLDIYRGETMALVGESGCGKSTLARILIRLLPPTAGKVYFEGEEITAMSDRDFGPIRRKMQMVFQDPYASLNPRMQVRDIIAEPLRTWHVCKTKQEMDERVIDLMARAGLPAEYAMHYPHQFSGGQRQRIGIARAIALDPEFLVCDEPVSALDVSVQSQVLNLLKKLKEEMGLTTLFIGHDLSVIHFIADRIAVMFLGRICEIAPKEELYKNPLHPYTRLLLDAIPQADPHKRNRERKMITGEMPSPTDPPTGCYFHTRCPYATDRCKKERPQMNEAGKGHYVACLRYQTL